MLAAAAPAAAAGRVAMRMWAVLIWAGHSARRRAYPAALTLTLALTLALALALTLALTLIPNPNQASLSSCLPSAILSSSKGAVTGALHPLAVG